VSDRPSSATIATLEEARAFYASELAGARTVTCHGKRVTLVFEKDATHVYSVKLPVESEVQTSDRVERRLPRGTRVDVEVRQFALSERE
jgi:hypothetical protein